MKRNFIIIIIVVIISIIFALINSSSKDNRKGDKPYSFKEVNNLNATYSIKNIENLKNTENFLPGAIKHIFFGTVNKQGEAEGFHYANVKNSESKILEGTKNLPNAFGVYKAKAEIDGKIKSDDNGYSTFFPNSLSPQMVINYINEAYNNAHNTYGNIYIGKTNNGMEIEMYLTPDKKIISAFPRY